MPGPGLSFIMFSFYDLAIGSITLCLLICLSAMLLLNITGNMGRFVDDIHGEILSDYEHLEIEKGPREINYVQVKHQVVKTHNHDYIYVDRPSIILHWKKYRSSKGPRQQRINDCAKKK
ncbi:hypothetical protein BO71DRAFT_427160 [Aspergillus ellipticus CBS 707.79]|uniref:Uncharacterized protein n=1 Tax=Aspergillus ellipticus CBS 707.79 TaxID=1448320 RepID=A0A319DTI5_9EURO|nr:hypothetical protein BO71DRAFT_427160 [Aspergillus ellipticus CBS 707.79]